MLEIAIEDSCGMEEVDSVRRVVDAMCAGIGRKVALVVNCDGFHIDEALNDAYFAMVEGLHARHYSQATSAFMRTKLGGALSTRQATAAVFESRGEAMAFFLGGWTGSETNGRCAACFHSAYAENLNALKLTVGIDHTGVYSNHPFKVKAEQATVVQRMKVSPQQDPVSCRVVPLAPFPAFQMRRLKHFRHTATADRASSTVRLENGPPESILFLTNFNQHKAGFSLRQLASACARQVRSGG